MKTMQPIKVFNVKYEETDFEVHRDEILRDPVLSDALTSYERLMEEVSVAEYEIKKLIHAKGSMLLELRQLIFKYVERQQYPEGKEKLDEE